MTGSQRFGGSLKKLERHRINSMRSHPSNIRRRRVLRRINNMRRHANNIRKRRVLRNTEDRMGCHPSAFTMGRLDLLGSMPRHMIHRETKNRSLFQTREPPRVNSAFRDEHQPFQHAFNPQHQAVQSNDARNGINGFRIQRKYCDLKKLLGRVGDFKMWKKRFIDHCAGSASRWKGHFPHVRGVRWCYN